MSALVCWGRAQFGQLGIGSKEEGKVDVPCVSADLKGDDVEDIASGDHHTLFLLKNGSLCSCGSNEFGQLGHNNRTTRPEPIADLNKQTVRDISAGAAHNLALTTAGEVFSWGVNDKGELGREASCSELQTKPKLIKSLVPYTVIQVSCGGHHSLSLTDDGRVFAWGDNRYGQLGIGKPSEKCEISQFIGCLRGIPVAQVAAGGCHSFILSQSGAVFGWGRNCFGQLGVNDEIDRSHPTLCKSLRNQGVKYLACGEEHTSALTQGGGVFTFGCGTYGQLGHNTKNNEILPRKVTELMGSHVTQIACGRRHTVAFVSESNKLYTFGSGACGQLGIADSGIKTSPVLVKWPSIPVPTADQAMEVDDGPCLLVKKVFAGGDHCFVIAGSSQEPPADYRLHKPRHQIKSLTVETIDEICHLRAGDSIPVEVDEEVTKIFSTASCLNASFLLGNNGHYGSNSKKHGVDMEAMRRSFKKLAEASNVKVIQKITQSIENILLPSLPSSPPDVEALRIYLLLPELHLFEYPKYYNSLITPLGQSVLRLDKPASRVLDLWWGSLSSKYFVRLVSVYKDTIVYILHLPDPTSPKEMETRFHALQVSLEMLKKLNNVNEQQGQIIAYNQFYISELKDKVNIKGDYVAWVQHQANMKSQPHGQRLLFCNYPFTFDAAAKSLLLQTDALMQMQSAIEEVQRRNIQSLFLPIDPVSPCLVFQVSRDNIVRDTIKQLERQGPGDLKKPLKVVFFGEEAMDEGGVRKEFFMLLLRELLDPKYGMFKYYEESHMEWFHSRSFEDSQMFNLVGCLCGLAIYNSIIIQLNFPNALFKKLLKRKPTLEDVKELMPTIGKSFEHLLSYDGDDLEDTFCLTFEITKEMFGEVSTVELVPGGSSKSVTKENRNQYVELYVDHVFNKSVEEPFEAFCAGFLKVCGGRVLELFHPQELKAMVIGNENYDFHELEKNTEYKGEYHRYHQTIKYFWDVFHDLTLEEKKKFLLFLTGSDKIPIIGMKYVKMVIMPTHVAENFLPVAHTCFNLLDLPKYTSKETLRQKLLQAIQHSEGFGLV